MTKLMISLCTKYLKFQCLKGNSLLTEEESEVFLNRWLSACLAELFRKKHFPFPFPIHMCLSRIFCPPSFIVCYFNWPVE